MKTIHKYRLKGPKKLNTLRLRNGYRVVRSEYLLAEKAVCVWVEEPLNVEIPSRERTFQVALSGEPVPESYVYRDTALDLFGSEAYHVFEVPEATGTADAPEAQSVLGVRAA